MTPEPKKRRFLICGRLQGFAGVCGRFAGNVGRGKRETVPILKSHKNIGALVVLGDFTKKKHRYLRKASQSRELPGNSWRRNLQKVPLFYPTCSSPQGRGISTGDLHWFNCAD